MIKISFLYFLSLLSLCILNFTTLIFKINKDHFGIKKCIHLKIS